MDGVAEGGRPDSDRLLSESFVALILWCLLATTWRYVSRSRVRTPFAIYFMQDRIGTPVNWVLSAVGRAYRFLSGKRSAEHSLCCADGTSRKTGWRAKTRRVDRIGRHAREGFGTRDLRW